MQADLAHQALPGYRITDSLKATQAGGGFTWPIPSQLLPSRLHPRMRRRCWYCSPSPRGHAHPAGLLPEG
eukprot:12230126-Alexandrium_andersonii.AAC.1